jgi:type I restriction enzyme S subunit
MSFPRYAAYKDSGVAWLGDVPSHWAVKRLRRAVQLNPSKSETAALSRSEEVTFLPMEAIGEDGSLVLDRLRPIGELESGYTYFAEGDVAIAKITPCFENGKGAVMRGLHGGLGFGTTELIVARPLPKHLDSGYLHRIFTSRPFMQQGEASMYGAGGQKRVPDDFVRDFAIALPPVDEQVVINAFLARETAKIDALVAEQEQLITLLKEKRQAVISHAVTKGLDPSVPMKDSGVEWLEEVPAQWVVAALNYRYEVLLGKMLDEKKISGNHLAPYLRNVDVQWDRINIDELPQMDFDGSDVERYGLRPGDLLVCEGGDVGRSAIWHGELTECYYQKALHRLRPRDTSSDLPRFQLYLMQAAAKLEVFTGGQGKATIAHLTAEALRRYRFAYPGQAEQERIVEHLDRAVSQFDELIHEAANTAQLLQERRSALISAAVTGQIDVRGLAAAKEAA